MNIVVERLNKRLAECVAEQNKIIGEIYDIMLNDEIASYKQREQERIKALEVKINDFYRKKEAEKQAQIDANAAAAEKKRIAMLEKLANAIDEYEKAEKEGYNLEEPNETEIVVDVPTDEEQETESVNEKETENE